MKRPQTNNSQKNVEMVNYSLGIAGKGTDSSGEKKKIGSVNVHFVSLSRNVF